MGLKHSYKLLQPDPADTTIVGATKWNADHYFLDASEAPIGAVGDLPYRGTDGLVTLLSGAQGVLTSAGSGNVPAWSMSPVLTTVTAGTFGSTATSGTLVSNDPQTVLNDGIVALGDDTIRGFLFVINSTSGAQALFTLNGAGHAAVEVADPAGIYTVTAGSASSINVYWSAGNNRYELENKRGVSVTLRLVRIGI